MSTSLGDLQFLYFDLILVTLLAIVMGKGGPSKELYPSRPSASLLTLPVVGSLFIHTCMIVLGQLAALFITTSQEWSVKKHTAANSFYFNSEYPEETFVSTFTEQNPISDLEKEQHHIYT